MNDDYIILALMCYAFDRHNAWIQPWQVYSPGMQSCIVTALRECNNPTKGWHDAWMQPWQSNRPGLHSCKHYAAWDNSYKHDWGILPSVEHCVSGKGLTVVAAVLEGAYADKADQVDEAKKVRSFSIFKTKLSLTPMIPLLWSGTACYYMYTLYCGCYYVWGLIIGSYRYI